MYFQSSLPPQCAIFQACVAAEVVQPTLLSQPLPPTPPTPPPNIPPIPPFRQRAPPTQIPPIPPSNTPPCPPTPPTPSSPDPLKYVLRSFHDQIVTELKRKIKLEQEEKFRYKARAEYFENLAKARKEGENLPKKTIEAVTRGQLGACGFSEARMDVTLRGQKRSNKWTIGGMKASLSSISVTCLLSFFFYLRSSLSSKSSFASSVLKYFLNLVICMKSS